MLDAALGLLRQGSSALSVRSLATELGASRQLVYSRFGSMGGLLDALYGEGFRRLEARARSVTEPPGTDAHVIAQAEQYRAFASEEPELFALMFGASGEFEPSQEARAASEASFEAIADGARAWLTAERGSGRGALLLARDLWSATHGVVSLEAAGHGGHDLPALIGRVLRGSR